MLPVNRMGCDSLVGVAIRHGLEGPRIESRWGRGFPHPSIPDPGPFNPPYNGYRFSFPEGKAAGGVALTTHFHVASRLRKEQSRTYTPLCAFMAGYWAIVTFTFTFLPLTNCNMTKNTI